MTQFGSHIKIGRYHRSNIKVCNFSTTIITPDTEIKIWFDSSGSMDTTLDDLQDMRDNYLKETLLPFYNNDETLYNEKVTVNSWGDERTFDRMAVEPTNLDDGIIHLVFQDEAQSSYHDADFIDTERTATYESDITTLRDKIANTFPKGKYQAFVYQVQGGSVADSYHDFLKSVDNGGGAYDPPYGLSDISENVIGFRYDIIADNGGQYYADLVEQDVL